MYPKEWQDKICAEYQSSNHHTSQTLILHNEEQDQSYGFPSQTPKETTHIC